MGVISQDHSKLDSDTVAEAIRPLVETDPSIKVKSIIGEVQSRFNYTISYRKAWLAKQKSIAKVFGDWEESFQALPWWLSVIVQKMPGSVVQIETRPLYNGNEEAQGNSQIALLLERLTSTMKFEELNDAKDGFSINNAIGFGKMGIMYKGTLANGWHLAIKKLTDSQQFGRQVLIEIRILGKLRHRNIVPLLGFCIDNDERILVYPYFSNGRLSKWLHPLETEAMILTWPQRINIALGVARALSWLHHLCNLHVVHLNICSRSILLDKNFEPKLSNFGDAKFLNPNNHESLGMSFYIKDGKKDVYDFGNVIFELVTGKLYEELVENSCNNANLSPNPSSFYSAIDKFIIGEGFESEAFMLIKIACECVQPFPEQRPTMVQVYNKMSSLWEEGHELCGDSNTSTRSESFSATDRDEFVEL
ncbi:probably inactive leucine-rich repeat receptor-like protein kinase At5g48380 [Arachis hypogaea]|uniref:probably inactive leucine-rich repeat receptor-like protein kinase At5g48380 n=2 Tax=Arachis TaxID=3817 RepID=UPI0007AFD17B